MMEHAAVAVFQKKMLLTDFPVPLPDTSYMLSWVSDSIHFLQYISGWEGLKRGLLQ